MRLQRVVRIFSLLTLFLVLSILTPSHASAATLGNTSTVNTNGINLIDTNFCRLLPNSTEINLTSIRAYNAFGGDPEGGTTGFAIYEDTGSEYTRIYVTSGLPVMNGWNVQNVNLTVDSDLLACVGQPTGTAGFILARSSDESGTVFLPHGLGYNNFDATFPYNYISYSNDPSIYVTYGSEDPITASFNASADTVVRSGQQNHNYGAAQYMEVQSSGNNRSLVKFDQSALAAAIGDGEILTAKLRLTITDNGNNWSSTGRTVDIHRLIADWTEGDGTDAVRGTGFGATWGCATDSQISNTAKNCTGATEWEMGQPNNPSVHPWIDSATATQTITNNQTGVVEYDVTADVAAFLNGTSNYGWIIRKTNEGQAGQVSFGTRESASDPQLVITYQQ